VVDKMTRLEVRIFADPEALVQEALSLWLRTIQEILSRKPYCVLALAGGNTPRQFYARWADLDPTRTPWDRLHIFWTDERYVPSNDPKSNFRMVQDSLLSRVPLAPENVHPIDTSVSPIERCAEVYEADLRQYGPLDLVLLGAGVDGHTASLFPGHAAVEERNRWVLPVPQPLGTPPVPRVTLTLPALCSADTALFLLTGAHKRPVGQRLLHHMAHPERPIQDPAFRVHAKRSTLWFVEISAIWV